MFYQDFCHNQINGRALIGQSAMVYCASKLMEKSGAFYIIIYLQVSMVHRHDEPLGMLEEHSKNSNCGVKTIVLLWR